MEEGRRGSILHWHIFEKEFKEVRRKFSTQQAPPPPSYALKVRVFIIDGKILPTYRNVCNNRFKRYHCIVACYKLRINSVLVQLQHCVLIIQTSTKIYHLTFYK